MKVFPILFLAALASFGGDSLALPSTDPAFSLAELSLIQEAIAAIPACHQHKLATLRFVKSNQLNGPADDCDEGFYPGNGSIVLYSRCGFNKGTVVHEIFHHLGRFNGMNQKWKNEVLREIPRCPVSDYAADGLGRDNEDLAEAGRILLVPDSGDRNQDACVGRKLELLRNILSEACG